MKRIGYPLTDAQIIQLIEGLPNTDIGKRWKFAIQLMAVYGLPKTRRFKRGIHQEKWK